MAFYLIGDVQGCNAALQRLLDAISFSPSEDDLEVGKALCQGDGHRHALCRIVER